MLSGTSLILDMEIGNKETAQTAMTQGYKSGSWQLPQGGHDHRAQNSGCKAPGCPANTVPCPHLPVSRSLIQRRDPGNLYVLHGVCPQHAVSLSQLC